MRGKLGNLSQNHVPTRITPAHAGKTVVARRFRLFCRDHPRACGENCAPVMVERCPSGSPPRMRGKLGSASAMPVISEDHPRACGENTQSSDSEESLPGSPPRMRGKPVVPADISTKSRITPAHAGKTDGGNRCLKTKRDHPRACGENSMKN